MSVKLPDFMRGGYDVLCRYMEKLPDGATWDILIAKVPSLRRLKAKEQDLMLEYASERGRLHVVPTARKGEKSAPLIRHTKFGLPTRVIEEDAPTPKNTVYVAKPGKPELQKIQPNKEPPVSEPVVASTSPQEPTPITEPTPAATTMQNQPDISKLRDTHLAQHLHAAAEGIMTYLSNTENGSARTELSNMVVDYHRLRGANRSAVLGYLVAHEGLREIHPEGNAARAAVFVHPKFTKTLDPSDKPYDHSAPELPLDTFTPLVEPTLAATPAPVVPVETAPAITSLSLTDIGNEIVDLLHSVDGARMPMRELHNLSVNYHNLTDQERRDCVQALVREDKVRTYRVPNTQTGTMWIKIYSEEERQEDLVVRQTRPIPENAMTLALKAAQEKAPMPELKKVENSTDPVAVPAAPAFDAPVTSSADLFAQIAQLTNMAAQLQTQEQNSALRETLRPLHETIVNEYNNVQTALSLQIDAVAALGIAVEQFTQAFGDK